MSNVKKSFLIDMDGVLVHGSKPIPGAKNFIQALLEEERKFLVVTNNALYTTRDLAHLLQIAGFDIPEENIYTSAVATAEFLEDQLPQGKAFVIGEVGLTEAIHHIGYVQTPMNPDYVVLGETKNYSFDQITIAIRLINDGARFIATNPDLTGPGEQGVVPSTGAMAALIEAATGKSPFYIGKPNPLMMRSALNYLGVHSENSYMIGDNMRTDILAGISAGMETVLVLTGMTKENDISNFPYRPKYVFNSIGDVKLENLD